MAIEGVDSSYDPPTVSELKAAGKKFSIRYVSTPGHQKNLTKAEADALTKAGLGVAIVGEISAGRALMGRAQGKADMVSFQSQAKALGAPSPCVIYMAVDIDVTTQMSVCVDYVRGAADAVGERFTGVYGEADVIQACQQADVCEYFWQTYAWSGGEMAKGIHLYQYKNNVAMGNATVDYCRAYVDDYGQWGAQGAEWWED